MSGRLWGASLVGGGKSWGKELKGVCCFVDDGKSDNDC